ncbi:unnamed protein product [Sphagnum balticum]
MADGGRNPSFNEKFVVTLAKGVQELTVSVWNSNSISSHYALAVPGFRWTRLCHRVMMTQHGNSSLKVEGKLAY